MSERIEARILTGSGSRHESHERLAEVREHFRRFLETSFDAFVVSRDLPDHPLFLFMKADKGLADELRITTDMPDDEAKARIMIFFEEMVSFSERHHRESEKREKLQEFLDAWYSEAFDSEYFNVFKVQALSFPQLISVGLKFSKVPELQNNFAGGAAFAIVDALERIPDKQERRGILDEACASLPLERQIDFIGYLLTLYGNSGEVRNAFEHANTATDIRDYAEHIAGRSDVSPFIHYKAARVAETLGSVGSGFHLMVRYQGGGRRSGRMEDSVSRGGEKPGTKEIWKHIRPDEVSYVERERAAVIARDTVGTFDQAWTLQSVASVIWKDVQKATSPKTVHFKLLEDIVRNGRIMAKDSRESIDVAVLLQELHHPTVRAAIEEDMGIKLVELSLREQIQLLTYLASVDYGTAKRGFSVIKQYGVDTARTFLSCEYGKHFGDAILKIADMLEPEAARMVFRRYAEIVDLTEKSAEELTQEFFVDTGRKAVDKAMVSEELLSRAKDLIAAFAVRATSKNRVDDQELVKILDRFQEDVVLFVSIFKKAFSGQAHNVPLEEIRGASATSFEVSSMEKNDLDEKHAAYREILEENWKPKGKDALAKASEGLEEGFRIPATRFYELRYHDKLAAFVRFCPYPEKGDGAVYCGSFNTHPAFSGASIGKAFLHEVLQHEGAHTPVYIHALVDDSTSSAYLRDFGFVITGIESDPGSEGGMVDWFTMERVPSFKSEGFQYEEEAEKIFEMPRERDSFRLWLASLSVQGLVVTGYTIDRTDGQDRRRCKVSPLKSSSST